MMALNRFRELIHQYDEKSAYLRPFLREPRGYDSILTAMIGLRFGALLGVILRLGSNRTQYADAPYLFNMIRLLLVGYFGYIIFLAALKMLDRPRFVSRESKLAQVAVDIVVFSLLYLLTRDAGSDLFILYSLPLLIAAEFFGLIANLGVLLMTIGSFAGVLWLMVVLFAPHYVPWAWNLFLPRVFFFLIITVPYLIHRRLQTPFESDVATHRRSLFSHLERIPDRQERKLFHQRLDEYTRNVERAAELLGWELKRKNELMNRQLAAIFAAAQAMVSSDEEVALARSIETLGEALGCQAGVLRLLGKNPDGRDSLVARVSYGYAAQHQHELTYLDLDLPSVAVEAFRARQPRLCRDVQSAKEGEGGSIHYTEFARAYNLHSLICVPLLFQNEACGTLSFYRQARRGFAPDERNLCQALASYLALTIANFRLYREALAQANQRKAWLDTLHTLGAQLAGFEDLGRLLQFVADKTRELLNAEVSAIFLLEDGYLSRKASAGIDNDWFADERYLPGQGLIGRAIDGVAGQPARTMLENSVDQSSVVLPSSVERYRGVLGTGAVKHLVVVPLSGQAGPFGVLRVLNRLDSAGELSAAGFTQNDVDLLYTIGCEVGIAIENARLLASAQRRLADERRKAREAEAMLQIAQVASSTLNLEHTLQTIVDEMAMVMEVEQAGVVLFDEDGDYGYLAAQYQYQPDDTAAKIRIPLRDNPSIDRILATKAPLAIFDAENDPLTIAIRDVVELRGIKSILIIPLIVNGAVIGTIGLDATRERRVFASEDLRLCQLIATQAAMAIENARLYAEAVEQKERLRGYFSIMSEKLIEHTDVAGLYTFIAHTGARFLNAEDCSLYLVDQATNTIDFVASSYLPPELFRKNTTPISPAPRAGLTAYAAATGAILRFVGDDYQRHTAWSGDFRDHLQYFAAGACSSLLIVPMRAQHGAIIGVLKAENKLGRQASRGFSVFDAELLLILAGQAALDIERIRAYERMSKEVARRERAQLAGDLHDALNTFHSGVMLGAETARYWLGREQYHLADSELEQLWRVARFTYGELSQILHDLRDSILQKEGLVAALRHYAESVGRDLIVFTSNVQERLDFAREYALYRIAQGAISNAVRHAGLNAIAGGKIWVDLTIEAATLRLSITDNGRGFDLDSKLAGGAMPYGFERMQKLAETLGAHLQLASQPDIGTNISVTVILKESDYGA
jgi:GAF domain-containing protein